MIKVYKHGAKYSTTVTCPICGCVFEYTKKDVTTEGEVRCPECDGILITFSYSMPKYVNNREAEAKAIDKCLEDMDFDTLATICYVIARDLPDYDFLNDKTSQKLKQDAIEEIQHCFSLMAEYGYVLNYRNGGMAISYVTDGFYTVNTYYDPNENLTWCTCDFNVIEGGKY